MSGVTVNLKIPKIFRGRQAGSRQACDDTHTFLPLVQPDKTKQAFGFKNHSKGPLRYF